VTVGSEVFRAAGGENTSRVKHPDAANPGNRRVWICNDTDLDNPTPPPSYGELLAAVACGLNAASGPLAATRFVAVQ